jgi:hypothetical protein
VPRPRTSGPLPALGNQSGGYLKSRYRADVEGPQQSDLGIAEAELGLPQRRQHIEQIGEAVMQQVGAGTHRHGARLRRSKSIEPRRDQGHPLASLATTAMSAAAELLRLYDTNFRTREHPYKSAPKWAPTRI